MVGHVKRVMKPDEIVFAAGWGRACSKSGLNCDPQDRHPITLQVI